MTAFCVDTIVIEAGWRPEHGVMRQESLAVMADARAAAENILERARADAEAIRQAARDEAARAVHDTERETLERARELLGRLEQANATFLLRAQDMVVDLAKSLFDRLVLDVTPRRRIESALKRVQREAPAEPAGALLRVHPADVELLPEIEWEIKPDAAMERGVCRLEAGNGEWRADFNAAAAALKAAFEQAVREPDGKDELS